MLIRSEIEKYSEYKNASNEYLLTDSLQENIELIKTIFRDDDTLMIRKFENQSNNNIKCCILFILGMINIEIIEQNIIRPIIENNFMNNENNGIDSIFNHVIFSINVKKSSDVNKMIEAIVSGNTVLLIGGEKEALILGTYGWKSRSIEEPEAEKVIRGPREGFTESLITNLSMIRRKLLTPNLKLKLQSIGVQSNTKICLCYIEGIANDKIISEVHKRLQKIQIDGMLSTGQMQEFIKDSPFTPFETVGNTERPDVVAAKLLEGRIAILLDGSPIALTVPFLFIEHFQVNEDYYTNFYFASISRLLRIFGFIVTTSLPAVFVAITTFHIEMLPTKLIMSISAARQSVPLPTVVEAIALLVVFEVLRETGTRMPTQLGQALSIVGALVLGQAAVDARFVSSPMVIVVALTGITGLTIPKARGAIILIRVILLMLTSILGLYGFMFGVTGILIHLFELRSFGVPFMLSLMNLNPQDIKDTAIRVPWFYMKYRPKFISSGNLTRENAGGRKK